MTGSWRAKRLLIGLVAVLLITATVVIATVAVALARLGHYRDLTVNQIDPASSHAQELSRALLDQETGVRGFALTREQALLQPYHDGLRLEEQAAAGVRELANVGQRVDRVEQLAAQWRAAYAEPTIARGANTNSDQGKVIFDEIRTELSALQAELERLGDASRIELNLAASTLVALFISAAILLVLLIAATAVVLYRLLITPLGQLAEQVREVANGDFERHIDVSGSRETMMLGEDVDAMRRRIVHEVALLDAQSADLQRSNSELEQFAYVASHDLQEPLRKVASFCQLLQRRYSGQLDARADQYIEFAVDGAKRMQVLINDLLALSRVGRMVREHTMVDCNDLVRQVLENYTDTDARIVVSELPAVHGETALLSMVFQNLVSNALKFRGDSPPEVHLSARRTGEFWTFSCQDNGIGIDAEHADRIFEIFQRLHNKEAYPGTGIGLAMCRKIIEYHGGEIWLRVTGEPGTTFDFTLPVAEESDV